MDAKFDFDHNIADMCISRIPDRMRLARRFLRNRIDVRAFTRLEYDRPAGHTDFTVCEPGWLKGSPKFVYEYCLAQGLKPAIEPSDKPMSPGNEPKRVFSITVEVPTESLKDEEPKTK